VSHTWSHTWRGESHIERWVTHGGVSHTWSHTWRGESHMERWVTHGGVSHTRSHTWRGESHMVRVGRTDGFPEKSPNTRSYTIYGAYIRYWSTLHMVSFRSLYTSFSVLLVTDLHQGKASAFHCVACPGIASDGNHHPAVLLQHLHTHTRTHTVMAGFASICVLI